MIGAIFMKFGRAPTTCTILGIGRQCYQSPPACRARGRKRDRSGTVGGAGPSCVGPRAGAVSLMRNRYVLLADLVALAICALGAFVLRLDWFFTRSPEYTAAFRFLLVASL